MGMGFGHAVLAHIPMHVEIGDHAPIHEFGPNEVAKAEFDALALTHLARDGEFDPRGREAAASFRTSNASTSFQSRSRSFHALRRIFQQHHLGMDDAALGGKIVAAIEPLVAQPRTRPVGC